MRAAPSIAAVILCVVCAGAHAQGGDALSVDPRVVATWELAVGEDRWVLAIEAAGTYVFRIESATSQPGHSGTFTASGGKWTMRSTAGTPWNDGGTYAFADQDTISFTGNSGAVNWRRRKGASKAPAASRAPVAKIARYVDEALALARAWQADCVFTGVYAATGSDGTIDLARLRSPANMYGADLAILVSSPSAGMTRTYGLDAAGKVVARGPALPSGTSTTAIARPFLDLDDALAMARERGFTPPLANGFSFIDARLTGVAGATGRAAAIWTFTAADPTGAEARPSTVTIDAATGRATTEAELSGRADRERLAGELRRGTHHPKSQHDWGFYRKEADALAARWDPRLRLCTVELAAPRASGRLALDRAMFVYRAPAPAGAVGADDSALLSVALFPTAEGMLLRVEDLEFVPGPTGWPPPPAPEKILDADDAAARLLRVDGRLPVDPMVLALVSGDALARAIGANAAASGAAIQPATASLVEAMRGRFFWFARSTRTSRQDIRGVLALGPLDLQDVAIDAVTGEPFVRRGRPGGSPIAGEPSVDPAIVGSWRATVNGLLTTMEFDAKGHLRLIIESGEIRVDDGALVEARDGQWEIETEDGEIFSGTYRLIDPDTLQWIDPRDPPVTLKRVARPEGSGGAAAPPPKPPSVVRPDPGRATGAPRDTATRAAVARKIDAWTASVLRPADSNLAAPLARTIQGAIEDRTNARILVGSTSSRTGRAVFGLTFAGDLHTFDLSPAQARAMGAYPPAAMVSFRKESAEARLPSVPQLVQLGEIRFEGAPPYLGTAEIKGACDVNVLAPLPEGQRYVLHTFYKTYDFDMLAMWMLRELPKDGVLRFEIGPVTRPDGAAYVGPVAVLVQLVVTDREHPEGLVASNTPGRLIDVTGDGDALYRAGIGAFDQLAGILAKVKDRRTAGEQVAEWKSMQMRMEWLTELLQGAKVSDEENRALDRKHQPALEAAAGRLEREVARLEGTDYGAWFLKAVGQSGDGR